MTHPHRHDPYGPVHKGIRAAHMRCLTAIGATHPQDDGAVDALLQDLADHLAMCETHLTDEETVLHTALEQRRPGASLHAREDHDDHARSFRDLHARLADLAAARPADRAAPLAALYRRFARFVADDLAHMDHEEQVLLIDLQAAFDDDELRALEGRIVASIPPDRMVLFLDAMLDGLPKADSDAMLGAMQAGMPPAAYAGLMQDVARRRASRTPRPLAA